MGILNMTPDSFYPGSRYDPQDLANLARRAIEMKNGGAGIIDIGAESTRPGAQNLDEKTELQRLLPAIRAIRSAVDIPISVDTRKSVVAQAAIEAGADIINDISAFQDDLHMIEIARKNACPLVIMHMQGQPQTMQLAPFYQDVVSEVYDFMAERTLRAKSAGVQHIIVDPGIGFGKRQEHNLALLGALKRFQALECPLLIGHSRKGFIGTALGHMNADGTIVQQPVEERLAGSLAVAIWCATHGVSILRVHDVAATADAIRMTQILHQNPCIVETVERGGHA